MSKNFIIWLMYPHVGPLVHATEVDVQHTAPPTTEESYPLHPEMVFFVRCTFFT